MRILRFVSDQGTKYGRLEEEGIRPLDGPPFEGRARAASEVIPLEGVRLLAPCEPSKIVAVGLNYRDHAAELGLDPPEEPMLFLKPSTSVIGPEETIRCPEMSERVDYEGELAIVVGRRAHRVPRERVADHIFGYTCLNDVTARDLQVKDVQFTRAKGFDTFAPIGPWIVTDLDPASLGIETYLNGELKQRSSTRELVFGALDLVHFISWVMTLEPGDVIASGTPSGIGPMVPGDRVEIRIEGIGTLVNPVAAYEEAQKR